MPEKLTVTTSHRFLFCEWSLSKSVSNVEDGRHPSQRDFCCRSSQVVSHVSSVILMPGKTLSSRYKAVSCCYTYRQYTRFSHYVKQLCALARHYRDMTLNVDFSVDIRPELAILLKYKTGIMGYAESCGCEQRR